MEDTYAVRLSHIVFGYEKDVTNIDDISFDVKPGEYMALIGHNGSGKSTIARLIVGLLLQRSGDISIFGKVMTDENVLELRKSIGIIFQNPDNQFIGSTVRDDIAFGMENNQVPPDQMERMVNDYSKKVGMYEFLDKEPSNLSGGQKQRVAIAGTLVRNPKILIMDEATSMLDPKGKREIIELIHKTKSENPNLTIISITHDIQEAYYSDHVVVLSQGKKVLDGKPDEVFSNTDMLMELKLDIPFFKRLQIDLQEDGIDIAGVNSIQGLVSKLCQ
jgi:energy-coupling factor transport system ATP-binding protein